MTGPISISSGESFRRLTADRKSELLDRLNSMRGDNRRREINRIISKGGDEAEFVQHALGRIQPNDHDSPENKSTGPIQTK